MINNILNLEGVTKLNKKEQEHFKGSVSREEYCAQLGGVLLGGNHQGDLSLGFHFYSVNCGVYGIPLL